MPSTRGARGAVQPRIKTGRSAPVVVEYQPSLISRRRAAERMSAPGEGVEPLPEGDIPRRLRDIDPVAATVAYRLAGRGNWDRVQVDPKDPRGVIVD